LKFYPFSLPLKQFPLINYHAYDCTNEKKPVNEDCEGDEAEGEEREEDDFNVNFAFHLKRVNVYCGSLTL
jgi:hypothetical protein